MTFEASARTVRLLAAARFALLAIACVAVAHTAIFAVEHGVGAGFAGAMRSGGHDGYWPAFSVLVAIAGTVLGLRAAVRLGRPRRASARGSQRSSASSPPAGPRSYPAELVRLWSLLFAVVGVAFAVQENVEHLVGHGHLIGLGALIGPEYPLALPVIGLVALAAAALGALVRWRIARLQALVAGRRIPIRQRGLAARRPAPGWAIVAALRLRAWSLVRLDAGRAPPVAA
jgi:hypothetical protein